MGIISKCFLALLISMFSFGVSAQSPVPQRCYFSGTYDTGFLNSTVGKMLIDDFLKKDLSKYIIYSFVNMASVHPSFFEKGIGLEELLNNKMIAIARVMNDKAPYQLMVLREESFDFRHQHSDLRPFVILMKAFGKDAPILEELLKKTQNDLFLSEIIGDIAPQDAVCNIEIGGL